MTRRAKTRNPSSGQRDEVAPLGIHLEDVVAALPGRREDNPLRRAGSQSVFGRRGLLLASERLGGGGDRVVGAVAGSKHPGDCEEQQPSKQSAEGEIQVLAAGIT